LITLFSAFIALTPTITWSIT